MAAKILCSQRLQNSTTKAGAFAELLCVFGWQATANWAFAELLSAFGLHATANWELGIVALKDGTGVADAKPAHPR